MSRYALNAHAIATGAVVDTYRSMLGLELAANESIELRRLIVSGAGEAAADRPVTVRITTSDQSTAGTSTGTTPTKFDPKSRDSIANGEVNYSAEPTVVATSGIAFIGSFNARGQLFVDWAKGEGPIFTGATTVLVQATPGDANATKLDLQLEWEEF